MEREAKEGPPKKEVKVIKVSFVFKCFVSCSRYLMTRLYSFATKPVEPRQPAVPREVRQSMVSQRHTMILNAVQENIAEYALKMEEKRQKVQASLEQLAVQQAGTRQSQWLRTVASLGVLRAIYDIVSATRKLKALDPERYILVSF